MPTRPAISFSAAAISSACARLSIWQGPAISASGRVLPKRTAPMLTIGFGFWLKGSLAAGPCGASPVGSTGGAEQEGCAEPGRGLHHQRAAGVARRDAGRTDERPRGGRIGGRETQGRETNAAA